jgi:antitoxin component of MazEF toxin-antitoxin module
VAWLPNHSLQRTGSQRRCAAWWPPVEVGSDSAPAAEPWPFGFQKSLAFSRGSRTINPERGSIMARERITAVGEAAALFLPKEVLDKLGIAIGDEVELSLIDRTLLLQPLDEADRAQQLAAITQTVFARRQRAYTELAQGPE